VGCHQAAPNCIDVQSRIEFNRQGQGNAFYSDPPSGIYRAHSLRYTDLSFDYNTPRKTITLLTHSTRTFVNSTIFDSDPFSTALLYSDGYYRSGLIYMKKLKFLGTVDPLGYPEIGENEFVFEETPSGVSLKVPVGAECAIVVGPYFSIYFPLFGIDGLRYYAERIRWECPSIPFAPSSPRWGWVRLTDELFIAAQSSDGDVGLKYVATNLPELNSFGLHSVIMRFVDSRRNENFIIGGASFEVFFPATGYRHPPGGNSEPPNLPIPNWFYYYWKAMGSPALVFTNQNPGMNPAGFYITGHPHVYVRDHTANYTTSNAPLFAIRQGQCPQGTPADVVTQVDTLTVHGIHAFAWTVYHEFGHKWSYETTVQVAPGVYARIYNPPPAFDSGDGDRLADAWETRNGLCPYRMHTTSYYRSYIDRDIPSDPEIVADVLAYGALLNAESGGRSLWQRDWSDRGLQYGNPTERFGAFPWRYRSTGRNISSHNDLLTRWNP